MTERKLVLRRRHAPHDLCSGFHRNKDQNPETQLRPLREHLSHLQDVTDAGVIPYGAARNGRCSPKAQMPKLRHRRHRMEARHATEGDVVRSSTLIPRLSTRRPWPQVM